MPEPDPPPPPRGPRRRRIACAVLLALIVLPILALLVAMVSLRAAGVRQAVLRRVSAILREDYGLAFAAEDFTPQWRRSAVELRNVRLGAPGAPPLATAERVGAGIELGSLRRPTLVVRWLEAEGLRVDLAARMPEVPPSEPGETAGGVEVLRLAVRRGEVVGAPLAGEAARWLRGWRLRGIEAQGSYRSGVFTARVDNAETILDRPGFGLQRLRLAGSGRYEAGRDLRVDELRASGDGVRLTASGSWGLEQGGPASIELDLRAASSALAAGVPPRGELAARGRLELPRREGRLTLRGTALPAEILLPYLGRQRFDELGLGGTAVDVAAEVASVPGGATAVTGTFAAAWRAGSLPLARADGRLLPNAQQGPVSAVVRLELLPLSPGRRTVAGTLRAPGWNALRETRAEELRIDARLPDVAATAAELRARWPRALAAVPPSAPLVGELAVQGRVSGPLLSPHAVVDASWIPRPGSALRLEARGTPNGWNGKAKARLESVPLDLFAAFAPRLTGSASGTVELSGSAPAYRTRVDLATTALALQPHLEPLDDGTLRADGTLTLRPLRYRGSLSATGGGLEAKLADGSRVDAERFALDASAIEVQASPLRWKGSMSLDGRGLALTSAPEGDAGTFELAHAGHLTLTAEGEGGGDLLGLGVRVRLDADRLALGDPESELVGVHLDAQASGRKIEVTSLSAELPTGDDARPPGTVTATGTLAVDPRLVAADLRIEVSRPIEAVRSASLTARLQDGALEIDAPRIDSAAGEASLRGRIPLGVLRQLPALAGAADAFAPPLADGPVTLTVAAQTLDSAALVAALGLEPRPERIRGGVDARLAVDLATPTRSRGEVRLSGLTVETPDGRAAAEGPVVLTLDDGRLELAPVHLSLEGGAVAGAGVDLQARADLDPRWRPLEDPPAGAVSRLDAQANATLDASLLNAYLEGGVGSGSLRLAARASGPLDRLDGHLEVAGPDASLVWPAAALRVDEPQLALTVRDGRWTIDEGRVGLNGGILVLGGGRSPDGAVSIDAELEDVRYRLDYGIDTLLSGSLAFAAPADPPGGRSRLSGRVTVERGVLDRNVDLDRELLHLLLAPVETASTEESALAAVDLDLRVDTTEGVRVRNDLADLHASWRELTVRGTLAAPILRGRVDVDPGGRLWAYGQTVQIDRGSLVFTGDPLTDPQVDLVTTSSLQDPRIARLHGEGPLALLEQQSEDRTTRDMQKAQQAGKQASTGEVLQLGVTSWYGARLAQRLGESAGLRGISVRPMVVLEGSDPSARLVIGRDLSRQVSFALSIDLRNAEHQTYLLSVGSVPALPGMRIEGFTTDGGEYGATLQQSFELGGSEPARGPHEEEGPRLRRIEVSTIGDEVSARTIRRGVELEKKRPLPPGAAFGVEVDLAELLRRKGYPSPRLAVYTEPVADRPGWVDLAIAVDPGPRVAYVFAGDRPPRALRSEITALYRADFYEAVSIEEMRRAAVRAFRVSGHVDPRVTIAVDRPTPEDPDGPRTVTVHTEAGPRRSLAELRIDGLDEESGTLAASAFLGTLARAELAAAELDADGLLLATLRNLGFPRARIAGRELQEEGARLVVRVEPGDRETLASVDVYGVEADEGERLEALLPVHTGDPARRDLVAAGALALGNDLRRRGFVDAEVRTSVVPAADGTGQVAVAYELVPGTAYRVEEVELSGNRWMGEKPLLRETRLESGTPLAETAIEDARNRLFRLGAFSRVDADVEKEADGQARVRFSLAERPRFRVGYGVRWESEVGTSAVVDFVDQAFLGRALTFGVRGLYQPDDRSGRLYLRGDRVAGRPLSLEGWFEQRRRTFAEENVVEDRRETSLQASRPIGATTARLYARHRTTHVFQIDPDPFFPIDLEIRLPYLGTQLVRDTRDDPADPTAGYLFTFDLSGSGAFLGSDFDYLRLFVQAAALRPLSIGGRSWTWAQSLRVGVAQPFRGQEMIREERFFAGGPYSVRGYELESLGPQETLGSLRRAAGGETLVVLNEELRVALPWDLVGLAFFDAGQVWATPDDADFDFAKSVGLGLRARTPIGLLRFDAAYPLDRRPFDAGYKLYFGFGHVF